MQGLWVECGLYMSRSGGARPSLEKVWCEFRHKLAEPEVFLHSTRITGKGRGKGGTGRGKRVG